MRRGQNDRSTLALVTAIALHALLVAALVVPTRRTTPQPPPAPTPPEAAEIAIDVAPEPTPEPVSPLREHARATAPPPPSRSDDRTAAIDTPAHDHDHAHANDRADEHEPSSPSPPASPVATMMASPPPAIGLALGGPNAFAGPRGGDRASRPAPTGDRQLRTTAEAKHAVDTALREPARARERELGLGPEGPVLQALGDATSASTAPVKGRAVFRAVADGTGMIVGIEVIECDGGRPGWASAAELARAALQGKKLRMPSTATRAEMRIEIISEWKLPSGHDPGTDVSVLGVPVAKGEGKKSTKVDLLNPLPKIEMVELAKDVKIPVPQISVTLVAVQGDPADIGAKPRRVVHTKLLDSKVL